MNRRQIFGRLYGIRWLLLFGYKIRIGVGYLAEPCADFLRWLFLSREVGNFTYALTDKNRRYLAAMLAVATGVSYEKLLGYLDELEADGELRSHLEQRLRDSREFLFADARPQYGRRAGWYAVVRALRPGLVVETGVDKGLGSCVLSAALRRNASEGYPGRYLGTDINPSAGYFYAAPYDSQGRILYGDSIKSLEGIGETIDVFINDSDHSAEYEAREYVTVLSKLSARAMVLGDNAHISDKLQVFALATGRQFLFFREEPLRHWYRGAGIGMAFPSSSGQRVAGGEISRPTTQ